MTQRMKFDDLPLHAIGDSIQMAGGIWQGEGKTFLCFFPKDEMDLPLSILEMNQEEWLMFLRQTDLLETKVLEQASDGSLAKALLRKSSRQLDQDVSWAVYRRDNYACRYCGNNKVPLTVDHIIRWEEGGPSIEQNLVSCCKKCNRTRGAIPYEEWLNHPYYVERSKNLTVQVKQQNLQLVQILHLIPRVYHKRSR